MSCLLYRYAHLIVKLTDLTQLLYTLLHNSIENCDSLNQQSKQLQVSPITMLSKRAITETELSDKLKSHKEQLTNRCTKYHNSTRSTMTRLSKLVKRSLYLVKFIYSTYKTHESTS